MAQSRRGPSPAKDLDGAFNAIQQVLTLDGRNFPGLLMSASMLESEGRAVPAALAYGAALANARRIRRSMRPRCRRSSADESSTARIPGSSASTCATHRGCRGTMFASERDRLDAFIDMTLRVRRRYQAGAHRVLLPGSAGDRVLRAQRVPWLPELEAATAAIGQELLDVLREDAAGFAPYIHYDAAHAARPVARAQPLRALERVSLLRKGAAHRGPLAARPRRSRPCRACRRRR